MRSVALRAALAIVVAACGTTRPSPTGIVSEATSDNGRVACEDVRSVRAAMGGDANGNIRVLSCVEAVAAAQARLPAHGDIASIVFARAGSIYLPECAGSPVPCPHPQYGAVYFDFAEGASLTVGVQLVGDAAVASEPQPGSFVGAFGES